MADPVKATKDAIWRKKQEIKKEQDGVDEWSRMLPDLEAGVAATSPEDEEYGIYKDGLEDAHKQIALGKTTLAKLNGELAALEAQLPESAKPAAPKFDPAQHPILRKAAEVKDSDQAVTFSIGDIVEAQWVDKSWYKAKIQSVLGSASAPKYLVRFLDYDDSMTVDSTAVRPVAGKRKREPETAVATASMPTVSTPHVISGPASINPSAQVALARASEDEPEVKKKKKIANKGQLNKRMNNWKDFQAKTAKKMPAKESMFRTSTDAGSRVGFTGSGKGMTETSKRVRHNFKAEAAIDEEYAEAVAEAKFRKRY